MCAPSNQKRVSAAVIIAAVFLGSPLLYASEKLLVSSFTSNQINRYSATSGTIIDTLDAGGGLVDPLGMTVGPDGNLYVASEGTDEILRFHPDSGSLIDVFVAANSGGLDNPAAVLFGADGNLYVSSFETDAVLRYDGATGAFMDVFVTSASGGLNGPDAGMIFGPGGDLFVPSFWTNEVLRYSGTDGSFVEAFVTAGSGGLARPRALHFRSSDGNLLVTSEGSDSVLLFDGTTGDPIGTHISSIASPSGMAFGSDGNLYVTSIGTNSVRRYDPDGNFIDVFISSVLLPTFLVFNNDRSPDFTEQEQFGSGGTIPIAWGDADNDGLVDLAVGNFFGQQNKLFVNDGMGGFGPEDQFGTQSTFALAWGDCDNDGDLDLAVGQGAEGQNAIYVNNGDGTFSENPDFGALSTVAVAWADFDNDGDLDLAVGNGILESGNQQNRLYVNNSDCTFVGRDEFGTGKTDSLAWGDFDNDGDMDLAVGNGGFDGAQQNMLYVNDGNGNFAGRAEFGVGDTASVAWGDLNNDGLLDLTVANWSDGQNLLYLNNGDDSFTVSPAFGARDTNTITMGDFNNDGLLDVAIGNGDFTSADQNYVYMNLGGAVFAEFASFGLGSTDSLAFADFDHDGDLDMAVGNEHTPTTNYLYVNNQNDGNYLIIQLVGRFHDQGSGYSNRSAIGARVSVYEAGHICDNEFLLGMRQIEAPGGFTSQGSLEAEFGVPGHATVDVRIDWPGSGGQSIVQEIPAVSTGQRIVVDEQTSTPGTDCNANGLSDVCDVGLMGDCNSNGVPDECDIAGPTSDDCTANGIPDECEPDCNNTGVADSCDILEGTSDDCSGNGIPDECEPDCNNTGVADSCDIVGGTSDDCSGNEIPDECEPDCNDTGAADSCDILDGTSLDCNDNEVPDECDIAGPTSDDINSNGIPDECDVCPPVDAPLAPDTSTHAASNKSRALSIVPGNFGTLTALRVTLTSSTTFPGEVGTQWWIGQPQQTCENSGQGPATPPENCGASPGTPKRRFWQSQLVCDPVCLDWQSAMGVSDVQNAEVLHVIDADVVSGSTYEVQAIDCSCVPSDPANYSSPLSQNTSKWADTIGGSFACPATPANGGLIDLVLDCVAILNKFSNLNCAILKSRADIDPHSPNGIVDIIDVTVCVSAFSGGAYPHAAPVGCP